MTCRAFVVAAVFAAGCASTSVPARWDKTGATTADYDRDSRACGEEAATATAPSERDERRSSGRFIEQWRELLLHMNLSSRQPERDRVFVKCMEARGWRPAKE
ncbi:MAG: hypothetical protein HYU41_16935 [Candidatus Rokubacteria bacterium]|nr:hypothetical protein [Candidatus Rokubacteria bacterium]